MKLCKTHNSIQKYFQILLVALSLVFASCEKTTAPGGSNDNIPGSLPERIILDTAYGLDAKQRMDIYLPAGRNSATRLIIMIHGGGWQAGDKAEFNHYKNLFRSKWPAAAIANINYRLASNAGNIHHSEIMSDISKAVNFMVRNKSLFTISDTLAMVGESAGAHLAMLYTYAHNTNNYVKCVSDLYGPSKINDKDWYNSFNIFMGQSISNLLIQYTGSTWTTATTPLYESVSPVMRVTAQSKPTIIFHGTIDVIVPLYQSQSMKSKLDASGVANEYHEYFLDGHGFNPANTADCATKTIAFFQKHLK